MTFKFRNPFTILIFSIFSIHIFAGDSTYFQQSLHYKIDVKLNDVDHTLTGNIEIEYQNNSPNVLDKIGMHLYPNAYSNTKTAFARQQITNNSADFYQASEMEMGVITNLKFTVDGEATTLEYVKNNSDLAWLLLPRPLLPGKKAIFKTDFLVKIPYTFSRLGHNQQSYQISQWHPKPAVYDNKGWHLMPYLDQGEFYSEFGTYEVSIDLPSNYVVGATGQLLDSSELNFLMNKNIETRQLIEQNISDNKLSFPPSSTENKKLHYRAENVHDFAWFADKRFKVLYNPFSLPSGKAVDSWSLFLNQEVWKKSSTFIERSIRFLSSEIAEYPWPQMTVVESQLKAGAGMEYPMITVIGEMYDEGSLDNVIAHEVFHNWFYGILGFNERDHPFLDEGITSYYENKYMDQFYTGRSSSIPQNWKKYFNGYTESKILYLAYARQYSDHFPDQNAELLNYADYVFAVYDKSAFHFGFLARYVGDEAFKNAMQSFYEKWKFKHPYPDDLRAELEKKLDKKLDWLFEGYLKSNHKSDYAIKSAKKTTDGISVTIKNRKKIAAPFELGYYKDDAIISKNWQDGFLGKKTIQIPNSSADLIRIDPDNNSYDLSSKNNDLRLRRIFKKTKPLRIRILPVIDDPNRSDIGLTPVAGWNLYNGFMLGAFISSSWFPANPFSFQIMPLYAFNNRKLAGTANVKYDIFFSSGFLHSLSIGILGKQFAYKSNNTGIFGYRQMSPYIKFNIRKSSASLIKQHVIYQFHIIDNETSKESDNSFVNKVHQLQFKTEKENILSKMSALISLQFEDQKTSLGISQKYLRLDAEGFKSFRIKPKRYFDTRIFVSGFLYQSDRNLNTISSRSNPDFYRGSVGLIYQNYLDQSNEVLFLGRSAIDGFWSQQVNPLGMGGFKLALGFPQKDNLGNSNSFVAAVNFSSDLPIKYIGKMFRPYFDIGYFQTDILEAKDKLMYSGGINVSIYRQYLNFFFPIINSKNIRNIYDGNGKNHSYWKEITFSFKLNIPGQQDILKVAGLSY